MTDRSWAESLVLARYAGNGSGISTAYAEPSYIKFDLPVPCKIAPHDEESVREPVACVVQNGEHAGETVYATVIGIGR